MKNVKRLGNLVLVLAFVMSMATTAFAGTHYDNDVAVRANSTWNSYLYTIGSEDNRARLEVNIPGKCYAALMGANSTSGKRYVMAHGDSAKAQSYNNTGNSTAYKSFAAFTTGNWKYCGIRLKNNNSSSKTFTDVVLSSNP